MIDFSLLITVGLVFLLTLVGAYMRSRRKDRCLKSWEGFHVTIERISGRLVWGVLKLEPTGMELAYRDSVQDEKHIESSYLLYASEYEDIQAIYRYADQLSPADRARREHDIRRAFHPGPLRRLRRALRNFLSTATDSLNEVLGIVLGRVQKTGSRYLAAEGSAAIKSLGGKVLGQVSGTYDPLLEHYIGRRVVAEVVEEDEVHEHVGIFKEYSADFIEILDVHYPQDQTVVVSTDAAFESPCVCVSVTGIRLQVTNSDPRPILIRSLQHDGKDEEFINAVVDNGETIQIHLDGLLSDQVKLHMQVIRELDMIVPRSRCLIRHSAENFRAQDAPHLMTELVFDVGRTLTKNKEQTDQETRWREELRRNPRDATAAANLGFWLIRQDALDEAEHWLRRALELEYSLPDGGRRARMELREIERRRLESNRQLFGMGGLRHSTSTVVNDGVHT